jgi:hypothetical protein
MKFNLVLEKIPCFTSNESRNKHNEQTSQRSNLHNFKILIPENVQNRQYPKRPNKLLQIRRRKRHRKIFLKKD